MRFRFIMSETLKGLTRNLAMTISVILVSFVSLLFVGASALLQVQIDTMKGDWYDKVEVSVYMCPPSSNYAQCADGEATGGADRRDRGPGQLRRAQALRQELHDRVQGRGLPELHEGLRQHEHRP